MKGIDMFCSSPASTSIIHSTSSNIDQSSMLRRTKTTKNYYNHEQRKNLFQHVPCSSQLPINPKPNFFQKHRKSSADSTSTKSSVHVNDVCARSSVDGSSRRYLLDDSPFVDRVSELNKMVPLHDVKAMSMDINRKNGSSALSSKDKIVVLRVSLHCKACEGKVRKHISKMEGVRSFNIDLETKKVTIIGDVTPLGVLASVSKVKSAQLWPSTTSSSSSFVSSSSTSY